MPKAFFIDTSRCTACRGCQIACKEWNELKANKTLQQGTHQNPPDLNPYNWKLVRFSEFKDDKGVVHWNFFPDQCRHCVEPPCKAAADNYIEGAVMQDGDTGAVYYTELTKKLPKEAFNDMRSDCPYDIPRRNEEDGTIVKCDMCIDRVKNDMLPMCVKTCCTGTMNFGEREDMIKLAKERLAAVKKDFPEAMLGDLEYDSVIYLLTFKPERYWKHAVAEAPGPMNRKQLFAMMTSPLRNLIRG